MPKTHKTAATLEDRFLEQWRKSYPKLPEPLRQYPIKNPATGRFWRLDFAWGEWKVFLEIQGGAFNGGRHVSGAGQAKDYDKQNHLVLNGWRGLYFNTAHFKDIEEVVDTVAQVLCKAREIGDG